MYQVLAKQDQDDQSSVLDNEDCFSIGSGFSLVPSLIVMPKSLLSDSIVVLARDGLSFNLYHISGKSPTSYLSNYALNYPIMLDGLVYPSAEHYFQAQKTLDPKLREAIRMSATPWEAKVLGQECKTLPKNWHEELKEDVMRRALYAKFSQHKELRALLLGTGSKKIIAVYNKDSYWALGADGKGQNRMGKLLMETRERLMKEAPSKTHIAKNAICVY